MNRHSFDRLLQGVATIGPLLFFAVASIEGLLRPGYDPIAQPISALALGPRGWIQQANFALLAISLAAFGVTLRTRLRDGVASAVGPAIFGLMTIGLALAGIFAMDPPGAPQTLTGRLHTLGGFFFFPWMSVLLLLVARRFRRDDGLRPYFAYTLATALFCLATMAYFFAFVGVPGVSSRLSNLAGLVQRLQLGAFLAWMAVFAGRVHHRAKMMIPQPAHSG
jgi:hypothetical membrane protein